MNDEIKEILSYLKKKENTRRIKCITIEESKQLLDYITNLQQIEQEHKKLNAELRQENSNLKTSLDEAQEVLSEYKEENERLKDNAIHNDKVVDKARWNEMIYKSRCEKALDYVNNTSNFRLITLQNILQNGSDDNE